MTQDYSLPNLLPEGTHVVTLTEVFRTNHTSIRPRGSVGVVACSPTTAEGVYRLRFSDGGEADLQRAEIEVRKHFQARAIGNTESIADGESLRSCVIYRCIVGSRAYGLDGDESDTDRRGIYLPPAELHWSLYGVPEQLDFQETEEVYWELQKFLILALKANPNVLECLYSPLIETMEPLAEELIGMRYHFLSRLAYQTYNGYVLSQFKKLEGDLRNHGEIRWKHAMHLIRLLISGITLLKEHRVPMGIEDRHREPLLEIRRGERTWESVNVWRLALHAEFEAAFAETALPERPDYAAANEFLIRARRSRI